MRYATSAVIAAWTVGMTMVFGWGLYFVGLILKDAVIDGEPMQWDPPMSWTARLVMYLLFFGVYFGFSGGCILAGARLLRALWRHHDSEPEVVPAPRPRGDILTLRRPGFPFIPFGLLVALVGWLCVLGWAADLLRLDPRGEPAARRGRTTARAPTRRRDLRRERAWSPLPRRLDRVRLEAADVAGRARRLAAPTRQVRGPG
jgi:hypothetical protein